MILVRTSWHNLTIILLGPLLVLVGWVTRRILLLDIPVSILPYSLIWTQCSARWRHRRSLILWSIETSLTLKLVCCCLLCRQYFSSLSWYRMLRWHFRCLRYCGAMNACNPLWLWSRSICKCLSWNCNTYWTCSCALTQIVLLSLPYGKARTRCFWMWSFICSLIVVNLLLISHNPELVSSSSWVGEIWLRSRWSRTS